MIPPVEVTDTIDELNRIYRMYGVQVVTGGFLFLHHDHQLYRIYFDRDALTYKLWGEGAYRGRDDPQD